MLIPGHHVQCYAKKRRPPFSRTPSSIPYRTYAPCQRFSVKRLVLLLVAVSGVGSVGIGSAVLTLETDGLVDVKVAGDGVEGSADGETDDDT